jgi:hypothetical protein
MIPNQMSTKDIKSIDYKGYQINCLQRIQNQLSTKDIKSNVYKGNQIN